LLEVTEQLVVVTHMYQLAAAVVAAGLETELQKIRQLAVVAVELQEQVLAAAQQQAVQEMVLLEQVEQSVQAVVAALVVQPLQQVPQPLV
jgi:hypothetical protein